MSFDTWISGNGHSAADAADPSMDTPRTGASANPYGSRSVAQRPHH